MAANPFRLLGEDGLDASRRLRELHALVPAGLLPDLRTEATDRGLAALRAALAAPV